MALSYHIVLLYCCTSCWITTLWNTWGEK